MPISSRSSKQFSQKLLDVLRNERALTEKQIHELEDEAAKSGKDILALIQEKALVREEELAKARSLIFGLPYADLFGKIIPANILKIVPEEIARNYQMACFDIQGRTAFLAIVDPGNLKAIDAAEFIAHKSQMKVQYHIVSESGLSYVLKQYGSISEHVKKALEGAEQGSLKDEGESVEGEPEEVIRNAPVSKMVSVILNHAVDGKASDVHIEPVENETRVRFRMDGLLHTSIILPKQVHAAIVARVKVLANLKIDESRLPQDGRFRMVIQDRPIDFRVSTMPLVGYEKVVLRILDKSTELKDLGELGFMGRALATMKANYAKPHGMFLVTGPTGSGKSTTLYTILEKLNREEVNAITLEDPVEHFITGVNQSQVRPDIGLTFAKGLRSILRQDPDIIMVGEIRDTETAQLAVHAALTGHVVFSTLHTNDAVGAVPRLIDMGIEPFLIVSSLNIIVAQRLVRRVCEHCKEKISIPKNMEEKIMAELKPYADQANEYGVTLTPPLFAFRGKGCGRCENTGYKGRLVIDETLEMNAAMKRTLESGENIENFKKEFLRQGWIGLRADGMYKVLVGLTTLEEILNATLE